MGRGTSSDTILYGQTGPRDSGRVNPRRATALSPGLVWVTDKDRRQYLLDSLNESLLLLDAFFDDTFEADALEYAGDDGTWSYRHSDIIRLRITPDAGNPITFEGFPNNHPVNRASDLPDDLPAEDVRAFLEALQYEDEWELVGDLDNPVALQAEAEGRIRLNTDPDHISSYWELD